METHIILGIHVTDRVSKAGSVQEVLTEYGCNIKTRVGLHEAAEGACSANGVIVLEMFGDEAKADEMSGRLSAIDGVEVKKMVFEHA